jgi:hypothetical protein
MFSFLYRKRNSREAKSLRAFHFAAFDLINPVLRSSSTGFSYATRNENPDCCDVKDSMIDYRERETGGAPEGVS